MFSRSNNRTTLALATLFAVSAVTSVFSEASLARVALQGTTGTTAQEATHPVCMTRTTAKGGQLPVVLPAEVLEAMKAKGFQEERCDTLFKNRKEIERWRDYVCQIASVPAEATQEQFEANWGERPAVLCGMAELVSSPWNKRGEP